jgi:hypothetical protein
MLDELDSSANILAMTRQILNQFAYQYFWQLNLKNKRLHHDYILRYKKNNDM